MKRKKWMEEEEVTLMSAYSDLVASSGAISRFKTREKRFQPVADRVNSAHYLRDPSAFRFRWTWRDVSIKIQNMRHQYLGVKQKVLLPSSSPSSSSPQFDWDLGEHHWSNFLLYKQVFGDVELQPSVAPYARRGRVHEEEGVDADVDEDDDDGGGDSSDEERIDFAVNGCAGMGSAKGTGRGEKHALAIAERVVELKEATLRREEGRRQRARRTEKGEDEEEEGNTTAARIRRRRWSDAEEDNERWMRRRREERREEQEMEWMERMVGMQMDHEKQVLQMQAEASQAQLQLVGVLARLVCQFLGPVVGSDGGLAGLPHQDLHNLHGQQQQQDQGSGSMGPENGKSDTSSPGQYL